MKVYINEYGNYTVYIGSDCFEMDNNPMPNGINYYLGEYSCTNENIDSLVMPDNYPDGLKRNIEKRLQAE